MVEKLLENMLGIISVSGAEHDLQTYLDGELSDVDRAHDEIGNLVFHLQGNSKLRILLAAHGDEIGLMITGATKEGFLKVTNVGGIRAITYIGNAVEIKTVNGSVFGVVVVDEAKLHQKKLDVYDLRIDVGATSKQEALQMVALGDVVAPVSYPITLSNQRLAARALDNKAGIYVMMESLRRAKEVGTDYDIYAASTVGEEMCKHGARWMAERVKPTEAIIIDVTYTSDTDENQEAKWGEIELSRGPVICRNPICDRKINQELIGLAQEHHIPYQIEVSGSRTCTDADEIHISHEGVRTAVIYIPLRYMHSTYEIVDMKDVEWTIQLLTLYLTKKNR